MHESEPNQPPCDDMPQFMNGDRQYESAGKLNEKIAPRCRIRI